MAKVAVYPGTFDPVTNGHVAVIDRARKLFDRVIVAVLDNTSKSKSLTVEERVDLLKASLKGKAGVEVDSFTGLLVDYLKKKKATTIIRGLRVASDLDYEFGIASMNSRLYPKAETVFLMPDEQWVFLSSSIVREVSSMGGDISALVPPPVSKYLKNR